MPSRSIQSTFRCLLIILDPVRPSIVAAELLSSLLPHGTTLLIPELSSQRSNSPSTLTISTARAYSIIHMPTQPVACIYYFQGDGHSVERWIKSAEEYFRFMNMPENEQVPYASNYLSYNVRACLGCLTCAVERISGRSWEWDWSRLKVTLRGIRSTY